jgi:hypothetical protein
MPKLRDHVGDKVVYRPPLSAQRLGAQKVVGRIIKEVWAIEAQRDPPKHTHSEPHCWGDYAFCSQLIEWQAGGHSIRLTYYRRPCGKENWQYAGQTSIETKPSTIKVLLRKTLDQTEWFTKSDRATD